jgi:hypothetical protein
VVSARVRAQTGQPALTPDATGVIPHFEIIPTIAPVGTGAMHVFDPASGEVGPEFFETPIATDDGANLDDAYWVDLGKAWRAPWPCTVKVTGGAVSGASSSTWDITVRRTRSQDAIERRPVIDMLGPCERMVGRKEGPSSLQRLDKCTITYLGVPAGTPVQLPRGVWAVQVLTTTTVQFDALLTVAGAPIQLSIPGGSISFYVEIA